jgi:peroxiredoxin
MLIILGAFRADAAWTGEVPTVDHPLVAMRLKTPASSVERTYLGLSAGQRFDPLTISGQLVFIEIFSMYCPHCQREAPAINRLYKAVEASDRLRGRVKMIGIGVGNSDFEVNHFKRHYQITFPLFADEDFEIHQSLGEVRTPFFIVASLDALTKGQILWTGTGHLEPVETVISRLKTLLTKGPVENPTDAPLTPDK